LYNPPGTKRFYSSDFLKEHTQELRDILVKNEFVIMDDWKARIGNIQINL
jgi:hypothetical protein